MPKKTTPAQKKQTPAPQIEPDDSVKLKPLYGIRPGVYLTALYSVILLLILFWIFVYHGLVNHGGALVVTTEPAGAAIRVNDMYLGISGTKIIIPKSIKPDEEVKIDVVMPGFEQISVYEKIPGRVFGTRFFPRVYNLEFSLKLKDSHSAVLAQAAAEFAAWSFGGEPTEAWQIPLVLSETAYRIGSHTAAQRHGEILLAASRFASTRAALRDLTRAKFLLDNGGNAPSPAAVASSLSDMLVFLSENPQSAEWLVSLLPPETAKIVRDSNWYKNNQDQERQAHAIPYGFGTRNLEFEGLVFTGNDDFLISETPVSKFLFEAFLRDNNEWTNDYNDYFENESDIATGMSWYAAEAFCKWFTNSLPSSMANMEVRLPTESEWLFANNSGIMLNTPGWEWCLDPFAPLEFNADNDAVNAVSSPERAIYGRQTANSPAVRTSLPPDFCSPVVTFRIVITVSN